MEAASGSLGKVFEFFRVPALALFGQGFGNRLADVAVTESALDAMVDAVLHFVGGGAIDDVLDEGSAGQILQQELTCGRVVFKLQVV